MWVDGYDSQDEYYADLNRTKRWNRDTFARIGYYSEPYTTASYPDRNDISQQVMAEKECTKIGHKFLDNGRAVGRSENYCVRCHKWEEFSDKCQDGFEPLRKARGPHYDAIAESVHEAMVAK